MEEKKKNNNNSDLSSFYIQFGGWNFFIFYYAIPALPAARSTNVLVKRF